MSINSTTFFENIFVQNKNINVKSFQVLIKVQVQVFFILQQNNLSY